MLIERFTSASGHPCVGCSTVQRKSVEIHSLQISWMTAEMQSQDVMFNVFFFFFSLCGNELDIATVAAGSGTGTVLRVLSIFCRFIIEELL